ncbi:MAG: WecB/TagA/CpsF family glycosyltransferase [Candidatus Atribacteria bacterium]|nr:WecB/TagA/CpsF family glycosyltransferase [Candidatus Atribacteria bacterium]
MMVKTQTLFGLSITDCSLKTMVEVIDQSITEKNQVHIVTLNPEMLARQVHEKSFYRVLQRAEFCIADGNGLIWASGFLGKKIEHRIPGIDLLEALFQETGRKPWSFYFLGSRQEVVEHLAEIIPKQFPHLRIAGTHDGFFTDDQVICDQINQSHPDIVLVGLGSPKQEYWIDKNRSRLSSFVFMGVGGSFDVLSGVKKRAPLFLRKIRLEWAYRVFSEPSRFRRIIPAFWTFGIMVWKEKRLRNPKK